MSQWDQTLCCLTTEVICHPIQYKIIMTQMMMFNMMGVNEIIVYSFWPRLIIRLDLSAVHSLKSPEKHVISLQHVKSYRTDDTTEKYFLPVLSLESGSVFAIIIQDESVLSDFSELLPPSFQNFIYHCNVTKKLFLTSHA